MAQYDVVSLDECKDVLGIAATDTAEDQRLMRLITMQTAVLEKYLNNFVIVRTSLTELFWGGKSERWFLKRYPITAITSIVDGATNALTEEYDYATIAEQGIIEPRRGYFPRAVESDGRRGRWTVTYSGGRFADIGAVGQDFKLATIMMVAGRMANLEGGVSSRKVGDLSISYRAPTDGALVAPEVEALMAGYVNRTF
jgi:hypothetical protein